MTTSLRKEWFTYVAKIRRKTSRKTKAPVTHREAMKLAATSWPQEKSKILNRIKREERKRKKQAALDAKKVKPSHSEPSPVDESS